jgi:hypothetical protein
MYRAASYHAETRAVKLAVLLLDIVRLPPPCLASVVAWGGAETRAMKLVVLLLNLVRLPPPCLASVVASAGFGLVG